MVFFGHFVDRIFSMPLILYSLCMVANAEMGEIVLLLGLDLLMVGCTAIGATQLHPWKWIWSLTLSRALSLSLCPCWPCTSAAPLHIRSTIHTHTYTHTHTHTHTRQHATLRQVLGFRF
jgi:bacteriorhodopsin